MTEDLGTSDALIGWFESGSRDLPWRRTRDPWAILVSEFMLQQTQVDRVVDPWHRFLERFPDPAACAAAQVADVIAAWAGLGFNRRAVNLHRCAGELVQRHSGGVPAELDDLLALPGVGPYTARAVLAFAYEQDVAVVDTNVARVLARQAGSRLTPREVQDAADALVPVGSGWRWNQAMLDLGARVCVARGPQCEACPVSASCAWRGGRAGRAEDAGPDPAVGSAGVSGGQSTFAGSDRQGRGRLVDALRVGLVSGSDLAAVMGWPDDPERARRVAATVVADGLAEEVGNGAFALPTGDTGSARASA